MIIDNIIVIIVAIILITYLSINYVKKYIPGNLVLISILAFAIGIYLPVIVFDVYLRIRYQIVLGIGIFFLPAICAFLQYNNINFGNKILYKRAEKCYSAKKYTKCITLLHKLMASKGKSADILHLISKCYYEQKDHQLAKENLYEVINLDEQHYKAYFLLGNILEKEDDIDSAIDMYQKCLEIQPSCYDAYEALGILLASKGELEKAEELYKKAIEYHNESYELIYNLAMIQLELEKTEDAEKNLEFALVINPEINEAIYSLANIKLMKGKYNDALSLYSEIIKSETYGLKAYYKIAIIYVTRNEFDKAMGVIECLINEDPSYIDIIQNEFVFNAMRSRIDVFLKGRASKEILNAAIEQEELNVRMQNRRNWFGRDENIEPSQPSVLYNDIDITRTGFRAEDSKNNK